jgi:hypothetical protein
MSRSLQNSSRRNAATVPTVSFFVALFGGPSYPLSSESDPHEVAAAHIHYTLIENNLIVGTTSGKDKRFIKVLYFIHGFCYRPLPPLLSITEVLFDMEGQVEGDDLAQVKHESMIPRRSVQYQDLC